MSVTFSISIICFSFLSNNELLPKPKWIVEIHSHLFVLFGAKAQAHLFAKPLAGLLTLKLKSEFKFKITLLFWHCDLNKNGNVIEHVYLIIIDSKCIITLAIPHDLAAITLDFNPNESKHNFIVTNLLALNSLWPCFLARILHSPLSHKFASSWFFNLFRSLRASCTILQFLLKNRLHAQYDSWLLVK